MTMLLTLLLAGCAALLGTPDPREVTCETGEAVVVSASTEDDARYGERTEVRHCRTAEGVLQGRHVEVYEGGAIAVIGGWADGVRDGTWTWWTPEGVFAHRIDFARGKPHGLEQVVSDDGLILQLRYDMGVASDMLTLPRETQMPEWLGGASTTGVRHLESGSVADP